MANGIKEPPPSAPGPLAVPEPTPQSDTATQEEPTQAQGAALQQAGQYAGGSTERTQDNLGEFPSEQTKMPVEMPPEKPQAQPARQVWGTEVSKQIQQEQQPEAATPPSQDETVSKPAPDQTQDQAQTPAIQTPPEDQTVSQPVKAPKEDETILHPHQADLATKSTDDIINLVDTGHLKVDEAVPLFKAAKDREVSTANFDLGKIAGDVGNGFWNAAKGFANSAIDSPFHNTKKGIGDMANRMAVPFHAWAQAFGGSGSEDARKDLAQRLKDGQIGQEEYDEGLSKLSEVDKINDFLSVGTLNFSNEQSDIDQLAGFQFKRAQLIHDADPIFAQNRGQQALQEAMMGTNLQGEQLKSWLDNNFGRQGQDKFAQYWGGQVNSFRNDDDIKQFLTEHKTNAENLQRTTAGIPSAQQQKNTLGVPFLPGVKAAQDIQAGVTGQPVKTPEQLAQAGFAPRPEEIQKVAAGQTETGILAATSLIPIPGMDFLAGKAVSGALHGLSITPKPVSFLGKRIAGFAEHRGAPLFKWDFFTHDVPQWFEHASNPMIGPEKATVIMGAKIAQEAGSYYGAKWLGHSMRLIGDLSADVLKAAAKDSYEGRGFLFQLPARTARAGGESVAKSVPYAAAMSGGDPYQFGENLGTMGMLHLIAHGPGVVGKSLLGDIGDPLFVQRGDKPNSPVPDFPYGTDARWDAISKNEAAKLTPAQYGMYTRIKDLHRSYSDIYLLPHAELQSIMGNTPVGDVKGFAYPGDMVAKPPGAAGRSQVFINPEHFDQAFPHETGHPNFWLLDPAKRQGLVDLIKQKNDSGAFTDRYFKGTPLEGVTYDSMPTNAEILNGSRPAENHGFTKDVMDSEMAAEQFGAFFKGKTIDQFDKNPSIQRKLRMYIGSALEKWGLPSSTIESNTALGVHPSVSAALYMDSWLRDLYKQRVANAPDSTGTIFGTTPKGPVGGGAPPGGGAVPPPTGGGAVPPPTGGGAPPAPGPGVPATTMKAAKVLSVRNVPPAQPQVPQAQPQLLTTGGQAAPATPPPPAPTAEATVGPPEAPGQIKLPPIGGEPIQPDLGVIKGLMKQGFTREQAEDFASKATVNPLHGAPKAQPVTPPAQQPAPPPKAQLSEDEQHAQIDQHIQSGKSPGEAQAIVEGRPPTPYGNGKAAMPAPANRPDMIEYPSKSFTPGRGKQSIQNIILHSTDGTEKGDLNQLTQHLSAHYYVTREGKIYHLVNDNDTAWHAGKTINDSKYGNAATLGIEQEHIDGKQDWPAAQVQASARLVAYLKQQHGLTNNNILRHSDIAPERKVDPVDYPWQDFKKYLTQAGSAGEGVGGQRTAAVELPKGTGGLNVTRFGYPSDPNGDPESAKGHGKYVQNMVAGYDVALNKAGEAKVGNPKPGEKFTYEGKEYRYGDKVPEIYKDARFDVYDPNFGGGEAGRQGGGGRAAFMPGGEGLPAVGGGGGGGGAGYLGPGGQISATAPTPTARAGAPPAAPGMQEAAFTPKPWPTGGGGTSADLEENIYNPRGGGGGGYGGGGYGGAAYIPAAPGGGLAGIPAFMPAGGGAPGGFGRRSAGGIPLEQEQASTSTFGVPNPGAAKIQPLLQQGSLPSLKQALQEHAQSLSPDDTRVKKQDDGLFKGEHFQAGDALHTHVLGNVPEHEKHVLAAAQNAIATKQPMHIGYASAPKEGLEPVPTTKSRQIEYQMSSPQARMLGTTKAQIAGHSFIPTSIGVSLAKKQGEPHQSYIQGVSTNAAANNHHHLNSELTAMGQQSPYPKLGHKFNNDLQGYVSNLNAGFKGTGEGPAVGTEEYPSEADPTHVPYRLKRHEADFLNAVVNNQAAKAKSAGGLRELAKKGGTLLTEEGETNPFRHAIDARQAGIRQKVAEHPENIQNPVIQKAAQRLWSQDTLEPTIRSFKAGLVHSIHEHPDQMPEAIRPGHEFKNITESMGRQAPHGRPDIPMAASFMPAGGYVSPNVEEGTNISGALKQMYSRPHRAARNFYQRVEDASRVGGKHGGQVVPTVGNWEGTAEGSALIHDPDDNLPEMRLKNAIRGLYSGQKGTASFDFNKGGEDRLYDIDFPQANHTEVDKLVSEHKFPANTIYQAPNGTLRAHIIDPGGENRDAAINLAEAAGARDPEYHVGTAAFDGGDTREEAAQAYRRIIGESGIQTREGQGRGGYGGNAPGGEHPLQAHYEEAEDNYQRLARERGWEKPEEEEPAAPFSAAAFMPAGGKAVAKPSKQILKTVGPRPADPTQGNLWDKIVTRLSDPIEGAIPLQPTRDAKGNFKVNKATGAPEYEKEDYDIANAPLLGKKGLGYDEKGQLNKAPKGTEDTTGRYGNDFDYLTPTDKLRLSHLDKVSAVNTYAEKLSQAYQGIQDQPDVMAGKGWYAEVRKLLQKHFPEHKDLVAQLFAATSARQGVKQNFNQAMHILDQHLNGEYDRHIDLYKQAREMKDRGELRQHVIDNKMHGDADEPDTEHAALADFIQHHGILPVARHGAKFGMNSNQVLKVLAGTWAQDVGGPKTPNYAGNLSGKTLQATIDMWAARHMRRLGHEGINKKPWLIQPGAETGVKDHDFALSQLAFRRAAEKHDLNPDDLQAIMWFAEQKHWRQNGWGAEEEAPDYRPMLKAYKGLHEYADISPRDKKAA